MTAAPAAPHVSLETILREAWKLLRHNWSLVVPLILSGVVIVAAAGVVIAWLAIAGAFTASGKLSDSAIGIFIVGYLAVFAIAIVVSAAVLDVTFGMADAAWATGRGTFAAGFAVMRAQLGPTLVSFLGYMGLAIVALILLIPTLGISMLAFPLITMYALPAVTVGGYGGFAAFGESWRLVRRYFGTSALAMLILYALQYLITIVVYIAILPLEFGVMAAANGNGPSSFVALGILAVLLAIVVVVLIVALFAYHAFFTLAIVGLYRWLHARAAAEDAVAAAAPPPAVPPPALA